MHGVLQRIVLALVVLSATLATIPATAPAADSDLTVTIAARFCDEYTDIFGNRARNNIMESLRDLGPDTPYSDDLAADPVRPEKEDLPPQSACKPLPNWKFVLGRGYRSRAVSGPWGSLSIVTGAFSTDITTKASTPLLNNAGQDTGDTIAGAVTIPLTQEQANIAARPNSLWIQGGTTTDPVLNTPYPGEYGFGALRCAIDDLNGDNVEWIGFPQGSKHVFCYAFYVKPPPTSGTIIVRKEISSDTPPETASTTFPFNGNISFNADQSFALTAKPGGAGAITFYRGEVKPGETPWSFRELVPDGWTLTGIACTSANGRSVSTTNVAAASTSVQLAASDTVTCTYTNRLTPPKAGLSINKVTLGAIGTFTWDVTDANGGRVGGVTAQTKDEGIEAAGAPDLALEAGDYRIQEDLPAATGGAWALVRVTCNGRIVTEVQPVNVTLSAGAGTFCTFTNRFTPDGTIRVRKKTLGAVGTTGFVITPLFGEARSYEQSATTKSQNVPVLATGDDTSKLRLGTYAIQETTPSEPSAGYWTLDAIVCNGQAVGSAQGQAEVTLTADEPDVDCTFTDRFTRGAEPPTPPTTDPDEPGGGVSPSSRPAADLAITKRVRPTSIVSGQMATYSGTLTNRGPDTAEDVTVVEANTTGTAPLSVSVSRGSCRRARPIVCRVGSLKKGESVTFKVTARPRSTGTVTNVIATNTSTNELRTTNNRARARLKVRRNTSPNFTG